MPTELNGKTRNKPEDKESWPKDSIAELRERDRLYSDGTGKKMIIYF